MAAEQLTDIKRLMKAFIQAGVIHCSDFRDQDIEDRAKVYAFSKGFAILQSSWFMCNIIARWASDPPVSPIELLTVAYMDLDYLEDYYKAFAFNKSFGEVNGRR
ncbi:hypothetical protein PENVUL_c028G01801 [Penicillium vulpinum]|uniref:Uncharacterized protein n=1 Tax=Penicillium vulpinum TaxID=29845 RepID=A0A1V6RT19_9EURO|nr:hypothetical protein PENVUL_c028G01801 [Penicillium vulpinum]